MKENTKIIIACVITSVITLTGSVVANTLLQANSISYKTSNGDTTDVNSALDRLFDINNVNERLGNTDIGDKTITESINNLNNVALELLWRNDNPTIGFDAQVLNLPENDSDYFIVNFNVNSTIDEMLTAIIEPGHGGVVNLVTGSIGMGTGTAFFANREITSSTQNSLTFTLAHTWNGTSKYEERNFNLIPVSVYGGKFIS